jgi:hypothetical protein
VKPFQKKELHDQTWNRTSIVYLQWHLNTPLWITRTLCYNRKKDGESQYIYLSNKTTSQVLLIGFYGKISEVKFSEVHFRNSIIRSQIFGSPFFGIPFSEVHFRKSIFRKSIFGSQILEVADNLLAINAERSAENVTESH